MSLGQVNSGYNILGQGAATAARMAPIHPPAPIVVEPKLDISWGDFHQGFFSSVRALFSGPFAARKFLAGDYFRDCWVERRIPKRAVLAAALWHVVFLVSPIAWFSTIVHRNSVFDNAQLTWSGPIEDFPALEIPPASWHPNFCLTCRTSCSCKPRQLRHGRTSRSAPKPSQNFILASVALRLLQLFLFRTSPLSNKGPPI